MTPKEEYEARKAARRYAREVNSGRDMRNPQAEQFEAIEFIDRIATALERIATALEQGRPASA